MSTPSGNLYHPVNKHPVAIYEGFSWPCLFFGIFWFLYKNMWAWAVIALFAAVFTWGISMVVLPFFANGQHQKSLLNKGYLGSENSD
ncbi:MAG: DUF2628 domain-containing protein [Candidatus Pacebacteria bacterium]|jgi:hypothetical protein|nr:DUF2628 domain-containing protein [Candidatus Paceibacterota bacterium]|tara:strand:- start:87 stop:347 length:261 start_codon:yes stop_codon:yes gene_type:complete